MRSIEGVSDATGLLSPLRPPRVAALLLIISFATGCACFRPPTEQEQTSRAEELQKEGVEETGNKCGGALIGLIDFLVSVL